MKRISMILDDHPLAREDVVALVRAHPDFEVLATMARTDNLERAQRVRPDLILLNLRREGDDSLTLARTLHHDVPVSRVVIMGLDAHQEDVVSFIRVGVSGFIMAEASFERFRSTIHSVARGIQVLPLELTRSLFGQLSGLGARKPPTRTLNAKGNSGRESEVAELVIQGLSNEEIAAWLRNAEFP